MTGQRSRWLDRFQQSLLGLSLGAIAITLLVDYVIPAWLPATGLALLWAACGVYLVLPLGLLLLLIPPTRRKFGAVNLATNILAALLLLLVIELSPSIRALMSV